jgi:hypothetical protein
MDNFYFTVKSVRLLDVIDYNTDELFGFEFKFNFK